MRQVVEVGGCAEADAVRLQSEVRAVYYRSLLPSIEKTCSRLSTAGGVRRIGLLEIDLGEVPLDALETVLAEKFDRAFAAGLTAAIDAAEPPTVDSDLEQYSYFIRTGMVPWWADRTDPRLVDASLDALIRRAPGALRHAIESAPARETVCSRLARAHPDRLLDDLVGMLAAPLGAAHPGLGTDWIALIEVVAAAHGCARPVARNLWWEELLRASINRDLMAPSTAGDAMAADASRFFPAILFSLAHRLEIEYRSFVADLHRVLAHTELAVQPWVRDVVESLRHDTSLMAVTAHDLAATARAELAALLARFEVSGRVEDQAWPRLMALLARLASDERAQAMAKFRRMQPRSAPLQDADPPNISRPRTDFSRERDAGVDLVFSDADEIYVENAGLVILWPFLENFFSHLDLIEAKQFRGVEARQRAIGLLQYLATEDAAASEFLVPLNKVLCGMPIDDVFDFGPSIAGAEIEACTDLLTAAIHHAPILHDMSIRGFRGSFLLRHGQLSVRDGGWLLRVERETHDIVLDRFPWSTGIVKLPWMETILQVEW